MRGSLARATAAGPIERSEAAGSILRVEGPLTKRVVELHTELLHHRDENGVLVFEMLQDDLDFLLRLYVDLEIILQHLENQNAILIAMVEKLGVKLDHTLRENALHPKD